MILLSMLLLSHALPTAAVRRASPALDQGDPPARIARVSYVTGAVSFQRAGDTTWSDASLNYPVTTGDRVYTDQQSRAELQVGPYAVRLSDGTDLTVTALTDQFMQLGLAQGTLRVSVYELPSDDTVEIDTPNGSLTLLEAGEYRVDIFKESNGTVVHVNRGSLEIGASGATEKVESGQSVQLTGTNPIELASVEPLPPDDFDGWSADRDRHLSGSPSAQYVSRDIPGYQDLDDNGRWEQDADYGPVWFPTTVAVGWVPYRVGHWAWIDPWGWTWVEAEPWGFAPFHYGRWVFVNSAWGWLPGPVVERPCYAPALVVFLGGSRFRDRDDQAWFPLGPREPYYPAYHHSDGYQRKVNETNIRGGDAATYTRVPPNINTVHYANRGSATTVVTGASFRGGQPVTGHLIRTAPTRINTAPITPHPSLTPTRTAARGGQPARTPPQIEKPMITVGTPRRGPERLNEPTPVVGGQPIDRGQGRGNAESPQPIVRRNPSAPPSEPLRRGPPPRVSAPANERPAAPPAIVARRPPPPDPLPLPTREQAMPQHPGRPLEPQQVDNLRAGRPAGPTRDQEVPPHPAPAPRPQAPAPRRKP